MLHALATNPLAYGALGLIVLKIIGPDTWKQAARMGPVGLVGAAMFIASTYLITFYHRGVGEAQEIAYWQNGLFADSLVYLIVLAWMGLSVERLGLFLLAAVLSYSGALDATTDLSQKWHWLLQITIIMAQAWAGYRLVKHGDLFGRLMWVLLATGETVSMIQVMDCQLFHGLAAQPIQEGSACANYYGTALATWLPFMVLFGVYAYILNRAFRVR